MAATNIWHYLAFVDLRSLKWEGISFIRCAFHLIFFGKNGVWEVLIGREVEFKDESHGVFLQKNNLKTKDSSLGIWHLTCWAKLTFDKDLTWMSIRCFKIGSSCSSTISDNRATFLKMVSQNSGMPWISLFLLFLRGGKKQINKTML